MLKRLELVGFKSFADKTRLDFDPGISAIVGPNGSGKSNIVDAIRWILGEQSAKSLRGKEMADCIFNGSGTRRSLGMAEVSIYLDNTERYLPADADEVVLTRRVYRSGEGEYLINGQIARLRDIKDLFLGTGAGHHAYSIIEQGKVDQILQSSTKDRRYIFEEAAGISRFKARKIDALKRLERVAQNLVRVQDIKEEIDKQLRSLRTQATRARRFRELSDRYKLLRLQQGADDYARLAEEVRKIDAHSGPLEGRVQSLRIQIEHDEARLAEVERQAGEVESIVAEVTARLSTIRGQMATLESEIAADHVRDTELADEATTVRRQLAAGQQRQRLLEKSLDDARLRHESALSEKHSHIERGRQSQLRFEELSLKVQELQRTIDTQRSQRDACLSQLSRLENEQAALDGQSSFHWQQRDRLVELIRVANESLKGLRVQESSLFEQDHSIKSQLRFFLDQSDSIESTHRTELENRRQLQDELAAARQEKIAVDSRRDVLEQLLARHEGLDAGVRTILAERSDGAPHWQPVLGVLAEQIQVAPDLADIVELALGLRAQSWSSPRWKNSTPSFSIAPGNCLAASTSWQSRIRNPNEWCSTRKLSNGPPSPASSIATKDFGHSSIDCSGRLFSPMTSTPPASSPPSPLTSASSPGTATSSSRTDPSEPDPPIKPPASSLDRPSDEPLSNWPSIGIEKSTLTKPNSTSSRPAFERSNNSSASNRSADRP